LNYQFNARQEKRQKAVPVEEDGHVMLSYSWKQRNLVLKVFLKPLNFKNCCNGHKFLPYVAQMTLCVDVSLVSKPLQEKQFFLLLSFCNFYSLFFLN